MSLTFASNLTKMIDAGLGGEVIAPDTSVAVGYQVQFNDVSGPVASWYDPDGGLPLKSLVVDMEPIQDLHGMPYPYPGGGSANIIQDGTDTENGYVTNAYLKSDGSVTNSTGYYVSEYFPMTAGETYTWSTTDSTQNVSGWCFYDSSKTYISGYASSRQASQTFVAPEGTAYCRASVLTNNNNINQIEIGSTATTPMYYSNICPISGRTDVAAWRSGKNLCPGAVKDDTAYGLTTVNNADGTFTVSGTYTRDAATPYYDASKNFVLPAGTYVLNGTSTNDLGIYLRIRKAGASSFLSNTFTLSEPANMQAVMYVPRTAYNMSLPEGGVTFYPMVRFAADDAAFEAYNTDSFTIQLGQTVYGGTLNVTSGVMTVDWANIASYDGEPLPGEWISDRDVYAPGTTPTTGAQVCYRLAEPVTVQLSPQVITSLKGQNSLWSDAGDVSVTWKEKIYTEGY